MAIIRLAHVSDIHFGGENPEAVAGVLAWIAEHQPALTIVSGDLTQYGEPAEFAQAAAWLAAVPGETLVTPGNHDAPYIAWAERVVAPFRRYRRHIGPPEGQAWVSEHLAVRALNTARGAQPRLNWSKGQIGSGQVREALTWFQSEGSGRARILVVHHPLVEMIGGPMTARVWGGPAAASAFAAAGVDLVLSGHIHAPFVWPYPQNGGQTYAVGASTLSLRERGVPVGFNNIEIEDGSIRVQALAWSGSRYESYRTWSMDRRPGA